MKWRYLCVFRQFLLLLLVFVWTKLHSLIPTRSQCAWNCKMNSKCCYVNGNRFYGFTCVGAWFISVRAHSIFFCLFEYARNIIREILLAFMRWKTIRCYSLPLPLPPPFSFSFSPSIWACNGIIRIFIACIFMAHTIHIIYRACAKLAVLRRQYANWVNTIHSNRIRLNAIHPLYLLCFVCMCMRRGDPFNRT